MTTFTFFRYSTCTHNPLTTFTFYRYYTDTHIFQDDIYILTFYRFYTCSHILLTTFTYYHLGKCRVIFTMQCAWLEIFLSMSIIEKL